METIDIRDMGDLFERKRNSARENTQTIEERCFQAAMIMVESHFTRVPPVGKRTISKSIETIRRTMEKTLNQSEVRECLAKNVDIWMRLRLIFHAALPTLVDRTCRELFVEDPVAERAETSTTIVSHHATIIEDLHLLNSLLIIARNMLAIKEVAQDICSATGLNNEVSKFISHSVYVLSKGVDGEHMDAASRAKVNDVLDLYKKVLVTSLQFTHNLTMGNDRLKMLLWFDILYYRDACDWETPEEPSDGGSDAEKLLSVRPDGFRMEVFIEEVQHWLKRNNQRCPEAQKLLDLYQEQSKLGATPGPLPIDLWQERALNEKGEMVPVPPSSHPAIPTWSEEALKISKWEQDRLYVRVSHEIDVWWRRVRDPNYDSWTVPMETVENAMLKAQSCKDNAMTRFIPSVDNDGSQDYDNGDHFDDEQGLNEEEQDVLSGRSFHPGSTNGGDEEDEDDEEEGSYVEEPLRGLMTEIPNILDTKQIEALHMTIKACIVDTMGSGLTPVGENLQRTRCKMFLALDFGRNLLREILVFIAVWEQTEEQFIFQITAQIVESIHQNALLPYAWNSLRILKDIVSPAQAVLLRILGYIFRMRKNANVYSEPQDFDRDAKIVHFLYNYFRTRVIPDCLALVHAQWQVRYEDVDPRDFPVDLWDIERVKDGLSQYLDFLSIVADIPQMRLLLIEWEATYELIAMLTGLEAGVAKKPLVEPIILNRPPKDVSAKPQDTAGSSGNSTPTIERPFDSTAQADASANGDPVTPRIPPLHETPYKYPWPGVKIQLLIILTSLVAPPEGRRGPGNATVQKQIMKHGGLLTLLNCCMYDGHNEYLKERATLALKFIMDGCLPAQQYVRGLAPLRGQNISIPNSNPGGPATAAEQALPVRTGAPSEKIETTK